MSFTISSPWLPILAIICSIAIGFFLCQRIIKKASKDWPSHTPNPPAGLDPSSMPIQSLIEKAEWASSLQTNHKGAPVFWSEFKVAFDLEYPNFSLQMKQKYQLSERLLQVACIARANLTLFEAMLILGLTKSAIETNRSRLRKVLGIQDKQARLEQFLENIAVENDQPMP